ncbi:formate--phosphoribosylaminoimidazolecarboxamide ligase [Ignicoccus hospitalis]|uniref:5-formaminoimidazole-4-carboxamide-1-(beta)-D-ribofuranosyl 5'-monophosphate synthetase n=1 Tax=Ignicoccus hospitalis (strain KIN4/I / DSM 18386 / JCM 14125) TaxID=453591 RepID=PURP_IGNH4|nr:formate--phosphoribosylaminoimidazolecarboxamide ligase [Ignicoccus hospitalis]A8A9M3.1 RecName: Full=5-formaminoimidazole-4-carboxamide-1-(beta)-D-ribofuranosyl 5'-monophosphate synthetase; AltName: Full=5-aminoimidazole-4-carboxamide-1-beta-D-ribofuranosyl 5'-monophosphate--formate ligase [Ignicoccus hospitalis KIN4/I]ABU81625.1 IMP biosynthesis enzyme PurP-like protein [Ignicoccus hospitalis KIN4/I]HIH89741.1 formate--phosphoribosylaminoimidazolecarboxamide ligase [Desulfurococcaceae archa
MRVTDVLKEYDLSKLTVATVASHSALQIVHGAKKEGLRTLLIVKKDRYEFYSSFSHLVDSFIIVESWKEVLNEDVVNELLASNAVLVPHGSFVEYVGAQGLLDYPVPIFGSRKILLWESDQKKKMELLRRAGIKVPREYRSPDEVDGLVIVKLGGAKGGKGYFLAKTPEEVRRGLEALGNPSNYIIQEYVIGVPAYYHFFYSPIYNRLEITGMDIRYESNVDGLRRLPPELASGIRPSFTVVGNIPVVLRESLLIDVYKYGKSFVRTTEELLGEELVGPFCLESIITEEGEVVVFEFSGRIVAGTNLYVNGSPYSYLYWDEPMSAGRRVAREIRKARDSGRLEEVLR